MTSRPAPAIGLPVQLSSFVGRTRELRELGVQFAGRRLVTLTGPGGSGKTRLALQFAESLGLEPRDLHFVDLAPLSDPALLPAAVAAALGVREQVGEPLGDTIAKRIGSRRMVVILDNLEQLPAAGPIVAALLVRSPSLRILATSRAALHVRGEYEYPVSPLALPAAEDVLSLENLERVDAVSLFLERSRAIQPGFALTADNASAVAEICARLDGLPLAIELAAYCTRLFTPAALLDRLGRSLPLLTGGPADAPARQRALHAAIAWSFDLLTEGDQGVFAGLGVFVGGATVPAAAAVVVDPAGPRSPPDLLGSLERLVRQNLLGVSRGADGEPRFRMLETIREFALERLPDAEQRRLRDRHLAHYLAFAEAAEERLRGPDQVWWIRQLVAEQGNFRAALTWARESGHDASLVRLAAALKRRFWYEAGGIREGLRWLEIAAEIGARQPSGLRSKALHRAGWIAAELGDTVRSRALFAESLAVAEASDDANRFEALMGLGYMGLHGAGDEADASEARLEEAIAVARRGGIEGALVESLIAQGHLARSRGDADLARAHFEAAVAAGREAGDAWGTASALQWLGGEDLAEGDPVRAQATLAESARLSAASGDKEVVAYATLALARALTAQGLLDAARGQLHDAAELIATLGSVDKRLVLLISAAGWLVAASEVTAAVEAWAAAARGREYYVWLVLPEDEHAHRGSLDRARKRLGPVRFQARWAAGRARSLDDAVQRAMSSVHAVDLEHLASAAPVLPGGRFELTPREREVLALVASGMSDGEIAEALVISKKTASVHVASIKGKLGASSRVEIATIALRIGLDASAG